MSTVNSENGFDSRTLLEQDNPLEVLVLGESDETVVVLGELDGGSPSRLALLLSEQRRVVAVDPESIGRAADSDTVAAEVDVLGKALAELEVRRCGLVAVSDAATAAVALAADQPQLVQALVLSSPRVATEDYADHVGDPESAWRRLPSELPKLILVGAEANDEQAAGGAHYVAAAPDAILIFLWKAENKVDSEDPERVAMLTDEVITSGPMMLVPGS